MAEPTNSKASVPIVTNGGTAGRGLIQTLIEAAKRQETLIDALTAAVDSNNEMAILKAAREIAANRRKEIPAPSKQRERKSKEPTLDM